MTGVHSTPASSQCQILWVFLLYVCIIFPRFLPRPECLGRNSKLWRWRGIVKTDLLTQVTQIICFSIFDCNYKPDDWGWWLRNLVVRKQQTKHQKTIHTYDKTSCKHCVCIWCFVGGKCWGLCWRKGKILRTWSVVPISSTVHIHTHLDICNKVIDAFLHGKICCRRYTSLAGELWARTFLLNVLIFCLQDVTFTWRSSQNWGGIKEILWKIQLLDWLTLQEYRCVESR